MARILKENIEREVVEEVKARFISDGWKEIQPNYKKMGIEDLRALATSKELEFDPAAKKDDLIKLLESAN